MEDLDKKIIELMDLFDGEVTTADKIDRPQQALDRDMYKDFMDRNPMAGGGMLVQPGFGGTRQGYAKAKKKINRDESYRKVVKDFVATSGPGTGQIFDDPAAIEIVKANLNKIKKQRNNKALFEWSEDSDWYRKLRKELNPNTKTGTNREYTNKLINQVVDEFFPGAYHGKNAIKNFRNDMVVKSFVQHLKSVGEFDGQEKFDPVLDQFTYKKDGKRKDKMHLYEDINRSWKSWINGEFEVDGVDRAQLKKELKARGIDYSQIDNWKAAQTQKRGTEKIAEIKFLDNQNSKFPNRSLEQVEELFKKKFPNSNFYLRVNNLTEIKRNGVYVSGATSERSITGIDKGDRAGWLKKAYGKQFAGNYSKIINAADQLAAAGETAKAERLYRAADKFFGPTGIIRKSAVGEAEHALARSFDFLNPDRQLAINSIVDGDLNQFKKNLFDIPVKRYFDEYNKPETTKARRVELKNLIEERKKIMNAITGGQKSGIVAGDIVNFRYGANEITATSSVKPIDTLFKEGKFNIDDYIERGNKYTEAFQTATKDINIKKDFSKPINKNQLDNLLLKLSGQIDSDCAGAIKQASKDGGRIGLQAIGSRDVCITKAKNYARDQVAKGIPDTGVKGSLIKRIFKSTNDFVKSALDPKELFDIKKQFFSKGAIASLPIFDAGIAGYEALAMNKPVKEAISDTFTFGSIPRAMGIGMDTSQVIQAKNLLNNPNLSSAGKEYAQLIIDQGEYEKLQSDATPLGITKKFNKFNELQNKIKNASTAGRFDYESLLNEIQATQLAKDEYSPLIGSLGDPLKNRAVAPRTGTRQGPGPVKIDLSPITYQNFQPNIPSKEEFDEYLRNINMMGQDQELTEESYQKQFYKPAEFQQLMEVPGFKGTQDRFATGGRAGFKVGDTVRKGVLKLIDESIKKTPKDMTTDLDALIKKTLDEDFFDKKDRIIDNLNARIAKAKEKGLDSEEIGKGQIEFYDNIIKSNFRTKTGPFFDYQKRKNKAGGGLLKQAGDRSGAPPESGPNSQGLQGLLNRVKKV